MDFHTFSRRELQTLCKKNKIPANITNVAMADALSNLPNVEGIDEIGNEQSVMQTPQTCKGTRSRKPIKDSVVSMEIESGSSIALTRTRPGTQLRNSQEIIGNPLEMLKTPATRGRRKAVESVSKKIDSENNQDKVEEENNNGIEKEQSVVNQICTRRSVRLSEKKACVSVSKKGGRKTDAIKISALSEEESDEIEVEKGSSLVVPEDASSMVVSDITTEETPTAENEESSLAIQVLDGIKHIALSDTTEKIPNVVCDGSIAGIQNDNKVFVSEDISDAEVSVDNLTTDNNSNSKSDKAAFLDSKVMPEDGSDAVVFDFEDYVSDASVFDFEVQGAVVFGDTSNVDADQISIPVDDVSNVNANQNLILGYSPVAVTADSESVPLDTAAGGEFFDANQSPVDKKYIQEEVLDILKEEDHIMESDSESSDGELTISETIEASAVGQLDREMTVSDPSMNEMTFSKSCDKMLETGEGSETEDSESVDNESDEGSETEENETVDSDGSDIEGIENEAGERGETKDSETVDSDGNETEAKADFDAIGSIDRATVTPKSSNKKRTTPTSKMMFKVYNENEENTSGDMSSTKEATPISKLVFAEDKENNQCGDGTQTRVLKQKSLRQLKKMFKKLAIENNHGKEQMQLEKARPALQALTDNCLVDAREN
ncbi:lisH domain-like protein [Thalictrum thalictroides]|uniref:LisH domain-like protein n=1 Tax=Thalictrum thalictroides TaxID=46969 RepID=A0A7J6X8D3_THATH|nr:lisH domain-like protein [Thalictrum thalictroides]